MGKEVKFQEATLFGTCKDTVTESTSAVLIVA